MIRAIPPSARMLLPLHLALTASIVAGATLVPPASGAMLVIALPGGAPAAATALAQGAALGGAGPVGGSAIVSGERGRLLLPLLRHGVVTVAAWRAGCGSGEGATI